MAAPKKPANGSRFFGRWQEVREFESGGFTAEMALGLIKTVSLQLTIDPDAPELVAAFESRGQMLRVRIQDPKKSDRGKLSELLMQLVS